MDEILWLFNIGIFSLFINIIFINVRFFRSFISVRLICGALHGQKEKKNDLKLYTIYFDFLFGKMTIHRIFIAQTAICPTFHLISMPFLCCNKWRFQLALRANFWSQTSQEKGRTAKW